MSSSPGVLQMLVRRATVNCLLESELNTMNNASTQSHDGRCIKPEALEKLRETIIDLFADGQFHEVGLRAICTRAKVSPQTVYKYFGNKEQLLLACIEQDMEALALHCRESRAGIDEPGEAMRAFIDAFFRFYAERPLVARIVYLNIPTVYWVNNSSPARAQLTRELGDLIESGKSSKAFDDGLSTDYVIDILTGSAQRIITRSIVEDFDPGAEIDALFGFLKRGLNPS